ncbi:MAG TPA: 3-dehydro-L-gulonate 2-dehydrogenase [Puia sp.]|nr:3-dehydro-L-gulonate 2-dehydrogenase [Puia sp.]
MKVSFEELRQTLKNILLQFPFSELKADLCAGVFASNSRDGVYSHGLNRFPVFIEYLKKGFINPSAEPELVKKNGLLETWDGHEGPGMYNATICMERAITLAKTNGFGCVNIRNSNHWMRGGTYGWQAADEGCIGICFTNAIAGMPPWGGSKARLGNNPIIIAVPRKEGHIVLDMAISQFSYGKMQEYEIAKQPLPFAGGYDDSGALSQDPALIRQLKTALPIGFWKGSGLALMLDILLTALGGGKSTAVISNSGNEVGLSQCFICFYQKDFHPSLVEEILAYTKSEFPDENGKISYPGERTLSTRNKNEREGIPVNPEIWEKVLNMVKR